MALLARYLMFPMIAGLVLYSSENDIGAGNVSIAQTRQRSSPQERPPSESGTLETRYWAAIKDSTIASDFQTYLDAYPDGQFADLARSRLQQLQAGTTSPALRAPPSTSRPTPKFSPEPPDTLAAEPPGHSGSAGTKVVRDCQDCPALVLISPGDFVMGSTEFFPFEGPVHHVTIRKPFYIGQREVTYDEWDACVKDGGCSFSPNDRGQGRGARPVTNLSWTDTQQFLAWLTRKTGKTYRLPTESEWEYAARGATTTNYHWGRAMEKGRANCSGCDTPTSTAAVSTGSFPPNPFGLYDMAGNAAEWVEDCWNDSYRGAPSDGSAWTKPQCQERVLRGGAFSNDPRYLRSAARFKYDFDVRYYTNGFRVSRDN